MSAIGKSDEVEFRSVSWVDAMRSILFMVWCQSMSRGKLLVSAACLVVVFLVSYFLDLSSTPDQFQHWFYDTFLFGAMPLFALAVSGALLRNEIKGSTFEYLWTRPVGRGRLLVCFYLTGFLKTFVYGLGISAVMIVAALMKGCDLSAVSFGWAIVGLFISSLTFCAGGTLLATLTEKYMILGVFYSAVIEWGIGNMPTNISKLSITHHVRSVAYFGLDDGGLGIGGSLFALLVIALCCVGVASFAFKLKAYCGGYETD